MCIGGSPTVQAPPRPMAQPKNTVKMAKVSRKQGTLVKGKKGKKRALGTQRVDMVINPSGVNAGTGDTGVYT